MGVGVPGKYSLRVSYLMRLLFLRGCVMMVSEEFVQAASSGA
jgi:hypothetical protein